VPKTLSPLCDLGILADQAAEPVPAVEPGRSRLEQVDADARQRALLQCPVRATLVVVFSDRFKINIWFELLFHVTNMSAT
jgi:hypothetical protein